MARDPAVIKPHFIGIICLALVQIVAAAERPNFVIIFTDDQGYGDLSCFGSETIQTPNIDRLAKEGRKFTSFMVASPVWSQQRFCSAFLSARRLPRSATPLH